MSIYSTRNSKTQKNGPSGAPGPAKRGKLPKLSSFLSQLKGGPFGEKTNFRKKSHNAEKLKGGPFGIFKHPICCKISKKLKGGNFYFRKKSLAVPKKIERGDPLGFFNIDSVAKQQKKLKGPFGEKIYRKKVSQCRKKN